MSLHKIRATCPVGDPDIGAEIEAEIVFNYIRGRSAVRTLRNGDPGYPADPDEIEFVSATLRYNGLATALMDIAARPKEWLDDLARAWLETEDGVSEAMAVVDADLDEARDYAAELRADR